MHQESLDEAVVVLTFTEPELGAALAANTTQALQGTLLQGFLLCPADSPAGTSPAATVWISNIAADNGNWAGIIPVPTTVPDAGSPTLSSPSRADHDPSPAGSLVPAELGSEPHLNPQSQGTSQHAGASPAPSGVVDPVQITPTQTLDPASRASSNHLRIAISDHVTSKIVVRDLNLTDFPRDSWPLALAIACDELLRASWLELSIAPPAKTESAPAAVRETVDRDIQAAVRQQTFPGTLFVSGALNWYSGGATLFGADLGVRKRFGAWGGSLSLGGRRGQWHPSDRGRGRLSTINFNGNLEHVVIDDGETEVQLRAGPSSIIAYAEADSPSDGVVVVNRVGFGLGVHAGVSGAVRLFPPVSLLWSLDLGYALRAVALVDSWHHTLTSTKGLEIQVRIGLEFGR